MNKKNIMDNMPIRICITSERYEICGSLFEAIYGTSSQGGAPDDAGEDLTPVSPEEELLLGIMTDSASPDGYYVKPASPVGPEAKAFGGKGDAEEGGENMQLFTEGCMSQMQDVDQGFTTVVIAYDESEITGMEGSHSTIIFRTDDDGLVHMIRSGSVSTALTFRAHHRAICMYHTPYMLFQIGIHSLSVDNRLLTDGELILDYIIEIRGGCAERCRMVMRLLP